MSLAILPKGADEVIEITLRDANGNPINPNDCQDLIVTAYQTKDEVVQRWKKTSGSIVISGDGSSGVVQVGLARANTANLPEKRLLLEVCLETYNTAFDNNTQRQIAMDIPFAILKNSIT